MRAPFQTRPFLLKSEAIRENLIAVIRGLPIDAERPLQLVLREEVKARKLDQQAFMWAGPLRDIAEQARPEGKSFSAAIWHEFCKKEFLPDVFDEALCCEGYQKWATDPMGAQVMIGSTTQLTVKGMAQYLTRVEAFGANLGVVYHANPNER